jgi:hypothetical protein
MRVLALRGLVAPKPYSAASGNIKTKSIKIIENNKPTANPPILGTFALLF